MSYQRGRILTPYLSGYQVARPVRRRYNNRRTRRRPAAKRSFLPSKYKKIPFNIPISQIKQRSIDASAADLSMVPNAASRIFSSQLTSITQGNTYVNRETNNIRLKRVYAQFALSNASATGRYIRMSLIGLRGSISTGDVTTWTDLFMDPSSMVPQGCNGQPPDFMLKHNRDEYTVIYDRKYKICGTGDGQSNTRVIKLSKPMNRLVQYAYNATTERRGALWLILNVFEEPGVAASADAITGTYVITTYFCDVRS